MMTSTGFLGTYVIRELLESDEDNRPVLNGTARQADAVTDVVDIGRIDLVKGDIMDARGLQKAIGDYGVKRVVHTAGLLIGGARDSPALAVRTNIEGTLNILECTMAEFQRRNPEAGGDPAEATVKDASGGVHLAESSSAQDSGGQIIARLDRIPIWALSYLFIGIIGIGYIFTFYDIFNINASWIQTCFSLNFFGNCAPQGPPGTAAFATAVKNAANYEGPVVLVNLIGYVVGSLALSPFSDRVGRRNMLLVTLVITGLGSLYNAFVGSYDTFAAARFLTGIGVGADLAIVNTYINEAAPKSGRARYTSLLFILAGIGVFLAIWLAVFLTTPAAPFPQGVPWAINLAGGWRWMYATGAILALIGILMRLGIPESPRWLINKGRFSQADSIVSGMEHRAMESVGTLPPVPQVITVPTPPKSAPFSEIFRNALYRNRTILLFAVWFLGYMTIYTVAAGATVVLAAIGFAFPENNIIVAVGVVGFVIAGIFAAFLGDKMERKTWLPISAAITLVGALLVGFGGFSFTTATLGITLIFLGMDLFVPITYTWVTESFPTRARATGFALADGGGHLGGGVGLIIVASLTSTLPVWGVMLTIASFQIASSIIAQAGPKTANKRLDDVSP